MQNSESFLGKQVCHHETAPTLLKHQKKHRTYELQFGKICLFPTPQSMTSAELRKIFGKTSCHHEIVATLLKHQMRYTQAMESLKSSDSDANYPFGIVSSLTVRCSDKTVGLSSLLDYRVRLFQHKLRCSDKTLAVSSPREIGSFP